MARAFWFSLLIGYLAGAFAVAIYLPRAILAPNLSNFLLLTGFSTLFVIVVSWRAWRARDGNQRAEPELLLGQPTEAPADGLRHQMPGWQSINLSGTTDDISSQHLSDPMPEEDVAIELSSEILLDDLVENERPRSNRVRTRSGSRVAVNARAPATETKRGIGVNSSAAVSNAQARVRVAPADAKPADGLIAWAEPLVQLPQRRLMGRQIQCFLGQGSDRFSRQGMVGRGLGASSIMDFDRAVMGRAIEWLNGFDVGPKTSKFLGKRLSLDLQLQALRSRKSRRLIDRLVQTASMHGMTLTIIVDASPQDKLPLLKPDTIAENLAFLVRLRGASAPQHIMDRGFAGVLIDRADLAPYLQLPLTEDPAYASLRELDEVGAEIVIEGFRAETEMRDIFDYPCHFASGALFGNAITMSTESVPNQGKVARGSESEGFFDGGIDRLRGQKGYGAATNLDHELLDELP